MPGRAALTALRRRRAGAQLLVDRTARSPERIVAHLLAVQAQDLRSARLALRARSDRLEARAVDRALAEGGLVRTWLCRSTLHLVADEDWRWLHALTAPLGEAGGRRRLAQLGVAPGDADRAVELVARALADEGPLDRAALGERLAVAGVPAEGQALAHLLALAARRGVVVLVDADRFALVRDRLGAAARGPSPERATALAELARRWLRGHGPAAVADLARWSGLPLRDARAGLEAVAPEPAREGQDVDLAGRAGPVPGPVAPRLLPAFDPYLLGWRDRGFAVAEEHRPRVHPGGGVVRAVALDDGRAVGTWSLQAGRVTVEGFAGPVDGFAEEAADVERFSRPSAPGAMMRR